MVTALTGMPLAAQWGRGEPPWGWHMRWDAWGVGMLLFMLLFWALVILGIVALVRWVFGSSGSGRRVFPGNGGAIRCAGGSLRADRPVRSLRRFDRRSDWLAAYARA